MLNFCVIVVAILKMETGRNFSMSGIVTCDRWGYGCSCKHGGYYTCADRYNPGMYIVTCDRWGYGCSCKHGGYYTCADRYNPGMVY
jgi:hypothetical protein